MHKAAQTAHMKSDVNKNNGSGMFTAVDYSVVFVIA